MAVNFLSHGMDMHTKAHEVQRTPSKSNPKNITLRNIINKFSKVKDKKRIIKVARENAHHSRLSVYFSAETLQARREWNIVKVLKETKNKTRLLYFRNKER